MELENLVTLIQTVSSSAVTEFSYEQGEMKLHIKKEAIVQTVATNVSPVVQTVTTAIEEQKNGISEGNIIKSPLVGRFYIAPAEDAKAFVEIGDSVKKGQTVAIVEAMKLMNDIESDFDGVVAEVFVENGEAVEYGQPLFRIV